MSTANYPKIYICRMIFMACLLALTCLKAPAQNTQVAGWSIEVKGLVTENDKRLPGAVITFYEGGTVVNTINSGDGKFDFQLSPDQDYTITFSKPGYITKRISFSTKNVPAKRAKYGFSPFIIEEVDIFPEIPGTDIDQILQQPIAKINYDPSYHNGDFNFDERYTESIQSLLDKILAAKKALDAQYKKLISQADGEFKKQTYHTAKNDYTAALKLKPYKQYPKDQLAAIERALKEQKEEARKNAQQAAGQKALQAKYDSVIQLADTAFNAAKYDKAKNLYTAALEIKSGAKYPESQLAKIDKILAENEKKQKEAQQSLMQQKEQAQYDSVVKLADAAFLSAKYNHAEKLYTGALHIKRKEKYPKAQIAKINRILAEKRKAQQRNLRLKEEREEYDSIVKLADAAFHKKNYSAAKNEYESALQIKPAYHYPKQQITLIDNLTAPPKPTVHKDSLAKAKEIPQQPTVKPAPIIHVHIAPCNIRAMGDSCRPYLRPFVYDGVNALHLPLKKIAQEKEISFPAFSGQRYRMIINISAMPQGTTVIVYNEDKRHKRRKALYSAGDAVRRISFFDADSKTGRFYIDYEIPADSGPPASCGGVIMLGFETR